MNGYPNITGAGPYPMDSGQPQMNSDPYAMGSGHPSPRQLPYMMGGQPQAPTQPLGLPQDPQSQYLAQALQQLKAGAQGNIRSPGALATNGLADALMQYGMQKRLGQNALQTAQANPMSLGNDPSAMQSMAGLY